MAEITVYLPLLITYYFLLAILSYMDLQHFSSLLTAQSALQHLSHSHSDGRTCHARCQPAAHQDQFGVPSLTVFFSYLSGQSKEYINDFS